MTQTFIHSGKAGDCLASLPTVQAMGGGTYHLLLSREWPPEAIKGLLPLLNSQEGIFAKEGNQEAVQSDSSVYLDLFRGTAVPISSSDLRKLYAFALRVHPDFSKRFLKVEPAEGFEDALVVNRTHRYQSHLINYRFLKDYKVYFVGSWAEFEAFRYEVKRAKYKKTKNLKEAAQVIAGAKCFLGNQSACWWIAEGLGKKRVLEVYPSCANCIPMTPNGYDCVYQPDLEDLIEKLMS